MVRGGSTCSRGWCLPCGMPAPFLAQRPGVGRLAPCCAAASRMVVAKACAGSLWLGVDRAELCRSFVHGGFEGRCLFVRGALGSKNLQDGLWLPGGGSGTQST